MPFKCLQHLIIILTKSESPKCQRLGESPSPGHGIGSVPTTDWLDVQTLVWWGFFCPPAPPPTLVDFFLYFSLLFFCLPSNFINRNKVSFTVRILIDVTA